MQWFLRNLQLQELIDGRTANARMDDRCLHNDNSSADTIMQAELKIHISISK